VYISQLILYARACFAYEDFSKNEENYWQISWCSRIT
jgi:hypothetical protein